MKTKARSLAVVRAELKGISEAAEKNRKLFASLEQRMARLSGQYNNLVHEFQTKQRELGQIALKGIKPPILY